LIGYEKRGGISKEYKFTFSLTLPEVHHMLEGMELEHREAEWAGIASKLRSGLPVTRRMLVEEVWVRPEGSQCVD
jgi:hypothetical protein